MKTIILCGGFGTRIRNATDDIPKPMNLIGNYPILWHIMRYYARWQHKNFVLCLGYKGHMIKEFFLNHEAQTRDFTITLGGKERIVYHDRPPVSDWKVTLADTGLRSMTGARIKKVQRHLKGEDDFLLTYGDGVGDVDLKKLVQFHKKHNKILTVTGVRPPGRFGELEVNAQNRVVQFNEKPQTTGGRISGGFFVCRKELFRYLDDSEDLVFENEPIRKLVKQGQLMMYEHNGFWQPMDTFRDYKLLNTLYEGGKAPWVL